MHSFLMFGVLLGSWTPAIGNEASDAPFRVSSGVFRSDQRNLGLDSVRGKNSLLYRATDDGFKFCHHPNIIVFGNKLIVMWSNGVWREDGAGQRILQSVSSDGLSWSEPSVLAEPAPGDVYVSAGFLVFDRKLIALNHLPS